MTSTNSADIQAIRDVVTGVAHHIDRRQWDALRALYADEVRTDYTSLFGGEAQSQPGDQLVNGWRSLLSPLDATQHMLGPIEVELRGDQAIARCHVRGYHYLAHAAGGETWMVAGHYVFELQPRPAGWRIVSMTLETFYQTGNRKLLETAGARASR